MIKSALPSIRRLTPDELETFKHIRLEALANDPAAFASVYEDWSSLSDEQWRERFPGVTFAAFLNEVPVGIMCLTPMRPRKMLHRSTLTSVYVRKDFRGTGLASRLLHATTDYARSIGVRQIHLTVSDQSDAALRFYRREGFVLTGRVPGGFVDGALETDEVSMSLRPGGEPMTES
jgi:L-amino acid N-acyltransferase YncA